MKEEVDLPKHFDLFGGEFGRGSRGKRVRLIQELLCLQDFYIAIDGDFGPATEEAVKQFQKGKGLRVDGIVSNKTYGELVMPIKNVLKDIPVNGKSIGEMVVAYAEQHLNEHPREIGGQNRGPWVRLYMNGREGQEWAWCAGFAGFILKQAAKSMNKTLPIKTSFSCDIMALRAQEKGLFIRGFKIENRRKVTPGSLFLCRKSTSDWNHIGIVTGIDVEDGFFHTTEGNSNDEGTTRGYEVCKRTRGFKNKDFILIN